MKRILMMSLFILMVLPVKTYFASGFDYTNGYFDRNPDEHSDSSVFDNDLKTSRTIWTGVSPYKVRLKAPINITGYYLNGLRAESKISFFNSDGMLLNSFWIGNVGDKVGYVSLKINSVREIHFINDYGDTKLSEFELFEKEQISHNPVTNLSVKKGHNFVNLNWVKPPGEEFTGVVIKQNNNEILNSDEPIETTKITNLSPETEYLFSVSAKYSDGGLSEPVTIKVKTDSTPLPPSNAGDVSNLMAQAEYNRVDLSWNLPSSEKFKHVNIYRDKIQKSFLDNLIGINTVMAATPIFETNGTYFNDLTVESETKYEYRLTTLSTEKVESDGVSITVTTLKKPAPEIGGGGYDKNPDTSDFTYYWSEPKTGKVKVLVGGKLHAIVQASDGSIIIKSADMKYSILGNPDVQLIPVDEDGNEGKPVKPPLIGGGSDGGLGGVDSLPFEVSELMKTTFSLLLLLSGIVLVALAIELTPRLVKVIKNSIAQKGAIK